MFNIFIKRPVLSLVISLIIVLLGVLALFTLPVTQFPDIVPPSVTVTANYTGANAQVCAKAVAIPLERAINGVPGMTYMSTVCSNDGLTVINIYFNVDTDPDRAAVAVQNRVATVIDELPEEVIRAGVTTEKEVNSMLMYLNIMSTDSSLDEKFIYNFTDINILQELKRIEGVGLVEIMGAKEYSMRVWLKPDRMASYKISTDEVIEAIRNQNVEAAPGKTGLSSDRSPHALQYVLRYTGKFFEPSQYENIVVRADNNGSVLKLKEIADIDFGSLTYSMVSNTDGQPSASIMIKQRPGSNARDVITDIKEKMAELKKISFPAGMNYNINYDVSRFLDASIHEVLRTLVEAFILVFIVVYIFLQDFRSTLIPALAVPVALIGTLFFMQMLGFSINLLTLFALVLAIGIVVDNAIVVVEAVHVKMQEQGMNAMDATIAAMKEISSAIVAITLVMSAVFVPVAFMSGPVGVFYRQFSLTLAFSIVISGINAVTLTPALCAIMLKNTHGAGHKKTLQQRFFSGFNKRYDALSLRYSTLINRIAARRLLTVCLLLGFFAAAWGFNAILPSGFIPTEDQGQILVNVTTPPGSTVERTEAVLAEVQRRTKNMPSIESVSTLSGYSLVTEVAGASYGMAMINLKDWSDRKESLKEVIHQLERKTHDIADASIQFFPPPTVPGFGNASGFEIQLLDRTGGENLDKTAEVSNKFISDLNNSPQIEGAFTSFDPTFPQYMISVDQAVAAQKGISIFRAMETLQSLVGSYYTSNFIRFGQLYKVMIQASPEYRSKPEDVLKLQIKNDKGEMVPFSTFIKMDRIQGPEQITRYNMYTAAMITGDAATGYSSGDAIKSIQNAGDKLPKGYSFAWSGMTREQILSGNQAIFIFLICLMFVYLLLAAQYESFLLPLPVILSLPTGIFGAFFFLKILGLENNIYAQVALVMLIGLLGKNAILIVEFAIQRQKEGISVVAAAAEGARSRLRPILMTSLAFIAGLIPLCVASGAGAMGNRSIGTAAAGGMLFGTIFGVILIPGLYVIFAGMGGKREKKKKKLKLAPVATVLLVVMLLGVSCTNYKAVTVSPKQDIPATYAGSADTTNIAAFSPHQFFSDPYLLDLIDTALAANLDLRSALQRIEIANAGLQYSRASLLPSLNAEAGAALRRYSDYTMDGVGNFDTNLSPDIKSDQHIPNPTPDYFVGLRSTWEVDLWGKLRGRKAAALSRFLASREGYRMVVTELVAQVATLYYKLLALDQEQAIVRKNIQLQENALEIVKAQKLGGRATELAVQQFQAQLHRTRSLLYTTAQDITETETQLNFLLGSYNKKIGRDTSIASLPLPNSLSAGVPSQLLLYRPDIREAEAELLAQNADIRAARAAFFPSLNLTAFTGYNAFRTAQLFNPGSIVYGITGGLAAPIFNRRAIKADYERSIAEGRQALYAYQKVILTSLREVTNSMKGMENYSKFYDLKQQEVASLNNAVSVANDLYLVGRASYLEVVTAQKNVLDAELEMTNAKASIFMNAVNLYRSVGGGWR